MKAMKGAPREVLLFPLSYGQRRMTSTMRLAESLILMLET